MTKRKAKTNRVFLVLLLVTAFAVVFSSIQIPVFARSISLSPPNGPIATVVTVTGTGFATGDNGLSCEVTSSKSGLISPGFTCTVTAGDVSGSFTVGPGIGPGGYTVTVTGSTGDTASSSFTVLQPTITLTPPSGPVSTVVNVKSGGVRFSQGETGCTISGAAVSLQACSVSNGVVTGSFTVASVSAGPYEIDVTGTSSLAVASAIFTVTATSTVISVTPTDGPFKTKITLQGSGFSTSDSSCQITASPDVSTIAANPAFSCSVGSGKVSGTFYVGLAEIVNTPETITVTASPGGDSASVAFTIDGSPTLGFSPSSPQPPGTTITVLLTGGQFSSGDTTTSSVSCSISTSGLSSSSACRIGGGGTDLTGTFFVVGNVASGNSYTVTVTGTLGDTASAVFTVAPPVVGPAIFLSPSDGPAGTTITVTGTGFPSLDSSCVLSSAPTPLMSSTPTPTCSIGSGKITASFKVASGAGAGLYTVFVTSSSGASASEMFVVDGTPTLVFTPPSPQPTGTTIQVSIGVGAFSSGDTSSCTISSTPSGLFQSSACHLSQSPQSLAGTFFVVSSAASGSTYTVTVRGSLGDTASETFTIAPTPIGPQLIAVPQDGPRGTKIALQGRAFSGLDTSCVITSTPANIIASPATCTVSTSGTFTTSFTVSSAADPTLNPYTITATGSSGDTAFTTFNVDPTPTLTFTPASPQAPGTTVDVSITISIPQGQFSSGDTSCSISSSPGGLLSTSACRIGSAGTDLTGTFFVVAAVPSGSSYTVVVTGNLGDTGVGTFQVIVATLLTLSPTYNSPGQTISFVARGLLTTDTSCSITSNTGVNGATLIASPSCTVSGGTGTGTFTVGPTATADSSPWTVTVTGNPGGDTVATTFTVVPAITVTPTNGVASSVASFTGSGFGSAATSCTLTSAPAGLFTTNGCNLIVPGPNGNGQVSGTFTVAVGAPAGTYVITVTDTTPFAASTDFTVGTPNAQVTVSPNVVLPGTSVGVTGFGFNGDDTGPCTISGLPGAPTLSCNISGGTVGGSIGLDPTTPSGTYLITVTGSTGDFASNYLEVILLTGTLTSITTTSTTSITSTTFTTFTTSTSLSQSFTTFTFTGITTALSYALSTITFTGQSVASSITTTTSYTSVPTTVTASGTATGTLGASAIRPLFSSDQTPYDVLALFAALMLLAPMVLRRLFF
ncbi:MAG: hypothetical protein ABSF00_02200 [Candidatus Bathyarchaeia archaeon]